MTKKIVWIDTETTGLIPEEDYTLEIAAVITDFELNELAVFNSVIGWPNTPMILLKDQANDYVREMHEESGLWDRVEAVGKVKHDSYSADKYFLEFLKEHGAVGSVIGGNSITHDRNFLKADLPKSYESLHYRSIDVTGIALLAKEWYGEEYTKEKKHEALADIRESIEELKYLRNAVFWDGTYSL